MELYRYKDFCLCPLGGRLPAQAVPVEAPFTPLVFLTEDGRENARGFYALESLADMGLAGVAALELRQGDSHPDSAALASFVRAHGAAALNTAFGRCFGFLEFYHAKLRKKGPFRLNLVGLGDVGGTLLTALKLLGAEMANVASVGVYDPNEAQCARYEMELNQVLPPREGAALPRVYVCDKEALFDCDAFLFTASRGVPALESGVADVRMAQYEANRDMLQSYARMARESGFRGLFAQISDPVDQLSRAVFLQSNTDGAGRFDGAGLLPEQVQGYGLGVMHARARYYAEKEGRSADSLLSFGPHGRGLVVANAPDAGYDEALSLRLSQSALHANMQVRALGFKPYIAPALSSACVSILRTLSGDWHHGALPLGGAYFGCVNRMGPNGPEAMRLSFCAPLRARLEQSYKELEMFAY